MTEETKPGKYRLVVVMDEETAERMKNAVFHTPGETLKSFIDRAALAEVEKLEKQNAGKPFPERNVKTMRFGRPIK